MSGRSSEEDVEEVSEKMAFECEFVYLLFLSLPSKI